MIFKISVLLHSSLLSAVFPLLLNAQVSSVQSWARFILQQLSSETLPLKILSSKDQASVTSNLLDEPHTDGMDTPPKCSNNLHPEELPCSLVSPIAKLFGVTQEQTIRCTKCGRENSKTSPVLLSSLTLQDLEGTVFF